MGRDNDDLVVPVLSEKDSVEGVTKPKNAQVHDGHVGTFKLTLPFVPCRDVHVVNYHNRKYIRT